jgi:hypothetical protein
MQLQVFDQRMQSYFQRPNDCYAENAKGRSTSAANMNSISDPPNVDASIIAEMFHFPRRGVYKSITATGSAINLLVHHESKAQVSNVIGKHLQYVGRRYCKVL